MTRFDVSRYDLERAELVQLDWAAENKTLDIVFRAPLAGWLSRERLRGWKQALLGRSHSKMDGCCCLVQLTLYQVHNVVETLLSWIRSPQFAEKSPETLVFELDDILLVEKENGVLLHLKAEGCELRCECAGYTVKEQFVGL